MVNTLSGMNGEGPGSTRSLSLSKYPKSYSKKLTSQIWSPTSPDGTLTKFPVDAIVSITEKYNAIGQP